MPRLATRCGCPLTGLGELVCSSRNARVSRGAAAVGAVDVERSAGISTEPGSLRAAIGAVRREHHVPGRFEPLERVERVRDGGGWPGEVRALDRRRCDATRLMVAIREQVGDAQAERGTDRVGRARAREAVDDSAEVGTDSNVQRRRISAVVDRAARKSCCRPCGLQPRAASASHTIRSGSLLMQATLLGATFALRGAPRWCKRPRRRRSARAHCTPVLQLRRLPQEAASPRCSPASAPTDSGRR